MEIGAGPFEYFVEVADRLATFVLSPASHQCMLFKGPEILRRLWTGCIPESPCA